MAKIFERTETPSFASESEARDVPNDDIKVDVRGIVARFSRGNPLLQLGNYITERDIAARRNDVCSYDFRAKCEQIKKSKYKR